MKHCFAAKMISGTQAAVALTALALAFSGCDDGNVGTTSLVLKSTKSIGELCLLKVFDEYVISNEVNDVRGIFVAPCDAILSVDFAKIEITDTNGVYFVSFPAIKAIQPRVDRSGFMEYEVKPIWKPNINPRSWVLKPSDSDALRQAVMKEAEGRIVKDSLSRRFIDSARCQATNIVASLIRNVVGNIESPDIVWTWNEACIRSEQ